ncbi:MFS transporter [Lentzea kentuckyensis]|uniref:MFS transporter n=1 Tax=Lentzea kentuckyensis TaxID=360086 RepID=UPI000A381073|nr:MFS transporter [Lentzea kentuckyensis]
MTAPLHRFLGPVAGSRSAVTMLAIGLIDATGTGLYLAGSAVFFTIAIGLSATQVGIGLSIAGLLGLVAQPVIGWLADRWGAKQVLIALHVWRALSFALFVITDDYPTFVVVTAMIGIGQQALSPVYQALVEQVVGEDLRVPLMARSRAVYNMGFSLGGLLAIIAISAGTRVAFDVLVLANAACCLVAALLLARVALVGAARSARKPPLRLKSLADVRYVVVALVNGVLSLHISLLSVGVPLWVALHTKAPEALVGALLVVNTVLAVLLQVWASKGAENVAGSVVAMRKGGAALVACAAVFALAGQFQSVPLVIALLVLGVVALTAGELFQSAGGWGLSYALAPEGNRSEYLATFNLGMSAQFVLGPTIVTVGVIERGLTGWLVLAGVFALATVVVGPLAKWAEHRQALTLDRVASA